MTYTLLYTVNYKYIIITNLIQDLSYFYIYLLLSFILLFLTYNITLVYYIYRTILPCTPPLIYSCIVYIFIMYYYYTLISIFGLFLAYNSPNLALFCNTFTALIRNASLPLISTTLNKSPC